MPNTFHSAKVRFTNAQEIALKEDDPFKELIAIGLQELTAALASQLSDLERKIQEVERQVRNSR